MLVVALGVAETVCSGARSYSFPVFLAPMEAEFGCTRTQITGAISAAALVAGVAAIPLGRWVDRHGARGVMTARSLLGKLLLLAWSRVESLWAFYALWVGPGVALLYEPAFAGMAVSGFMALVLSLARASAPVGASLLYVAGGGYQPVLVVALAVSLVSEVSVSRAGGGPSDMSETRRASLP